MAIHSHGQVVRSIPLHYIASFESQLSEDLNTYVKGIQEIVIGSIAATSSSEKSNEGNLLVASSIRTACGNSVHRVISTAGSGASNYVELKADIYPGQRNDLVIFIYVRDTESEVIFSKMYSLRGKHQDKPLPTVLLSSSASLHPSLNYKGISNQGLDTISTTFSGTSVSFVLSGFQYANGRRDMQFGYILEALFIVPYIGSNSEAIPTTLQLNTGVSSQLLINEFRLFNSRAKFSWTTSVSTDLTKLNFGRYNFGSGFALYLTKNFSLSTGIQLCNRRILPLGEMPLGVSGFDRLNIGLGLGF
jgi:hypothetical protein